MEERVAGVNDLQDGQMKQVLVGGKKVLLAKVGGRFYALGDRCTHYGGTLSQGTLHDHRLTCPLHQGTFDVTSGDLLEPPPLDALPHFSVRVTGDDVFVDRPDDSKSQREPAMAARDEGDGRLVAIVGGGAAGAAAAQSLREHGYGGGIVMVSREDRWPYDRPNLTKDYLAGTMEASWLPLRPAAFWQQHGVERRLATVVALDATTRRLTLDDGDELVPDAVLIATGAVPRTLDVPGSDFAGVFTLRSRDDCEAIIAALAGAERAVIVGSSFIGLEAAASLRTRGLDVTVVGPGRTPFARVLGAEVGARTRRLHEEHGTRFKLGATVARFVAGTAAGGQPAGVTAVELADGQRLPADLVIVGVGAAPATGFVAGVARGPDGGLETDDHLRVAPGVWAGGDIASYPAAHLGGRRVRIEHWRLAEQHGRAAGRSIAASLAAAPGDRTDPPFTGVPFFWTQQFDASFDFAGYGAGWDEVIMTGDIEAGFTALYAREGVLLGACGTQPAELAAFKELMMAGALPSAAAVRERSSAGLADRLAAAAG